MNNQVKWIIIVSLFLLTGCETSTPLHMPDKDARMHYLKLNPVNDPYISGAIKKGRIVPGMTKEQVKSTWGEPAMRGSSDGNTEACATFIFFLLTGSSQRSASTLKENIHPVNSNRQIKFDKNGGYLIHKLKFPWPNFIKNWMKS